MIQNGMKHCIEQVIKAEMRYKQMRGYTSVIKNDSQFQY